MSGVLWPVFPFRKILQRHLLDIWETGHMDRVETVLQRFQEHARECSVCIQDNNLVCLEGLFIMSHIFQAFTEDEVYGPQRQ